MQNTAQKVILNNIGIPQIAPGFDPNCGGDTFDGPVHFDGNPGAQELASQGQLPPATSYCRRTPRVG
jgi:hypothetical protein